MVYPLDMSAAEFNAVNARFCVYARLEGTVVVGCLGSLRAEHLTPKQISYIRSFYMIADGEWTHEIVEDWPQWKLPRGTFNNFIVFRKVTDPDGKEST